jgi:hypothetical protein
MVDTAVVLTAVLMLSRLIELGGGSVTVTYAVRVAVSLPSLFDAVSDTS